MSHAAPQGTQLLHGFKRANRFQKAMVARLPDAYRKFWREWKLNPTVAVHYIPKDSKWELDEVTHKIKDIQNISVPLIDTAESHDAIWGGEAIINGFQKRHQTKRRVPHFWVPVLRRSVVHSQVLNEYVSVVVTERTLQQIHESRGLDHYLLKNLACDLRSALALKIKRKILQALLDGCPSLATEPMQQRYILNEYKRYLEAYTPEEIDWYGYTYLEAIRKLYTQLHEAEKALPHKVEFRIKLIEQLKQAGICNGLATQKKNSTQMAEFETVTNDKLTQPIPNWLSKINPFGLKKVAK